MLVKKLRELASDFRAAIEESKDVEPTLHRLAAFPKDCCDISSIFLNAYLKANEVAGIEEVRGEPAGPDAQQWAHTWLEANGIVIDITADQFGRPPVIVTRHSAWHSQLKKQGREPARPVDKQHGPVYEKIAKFARQRPKP